MRTTIPGLASGTTYVVRMRSKNATETSDWSFGLVFTTPGLAGSSISGYYGLVYVQPNEPLGVPVGTLWFDTDDFSV
jgi:hypothetical protein